MKILVVCAHLDDEMFGFGGSLFKLSLNNEVRVLTMCKGRNENDMHSREKTHDFIMNQLGVEYQTLDYIDLSLPEITQPVISDHISDTINEFRPDIVFSTSENDIHRDHVVVAHATKVVCRPMSSTPVKELYQFSVPASSQWNFSPVVYNTGIDITEFIDQKLTWCELYTTEIKQDPTHPNSIEGIKTFNKYIGNIFGFEYGESCQLIYKKF